MAGTARSPWAIGEAEAERRERAAFLQYLCVVRQIMVPGMARERALMMLARHGYTLRDVARFRAYKERSHG